MSPDTPEPPGGRRPAAATERLTEGDLAGAVDELDAAAEEHLRAGEGDAAATALHLAAASARLRGDLAGAVARADRSAALAEPGTPTWVAATVEQAEAALAEGRTVDAVAGLDVVLGLEGEVRLNAGGRGALLQRRAAGLAAVGRAGEAEASLREAVAAFEEAGLEDQRRQAELSRVTLLVQVDPGAAEPAAVALGLRALEAGDVAILTDLDLLDASAALAAGDAARGAEAFGRARAHALEAVLPDRYLAAALGAARVAESRGDPDAAYACLTTAWATVGDLLGRDAADGLVRPAIAEMRDRLGTERFASVKAAHDTARRAVRSAAEGQPPDQVGG